MSAPRIALIRQKYNPAGGAERFVSRATRALVEQGADITLITRKWDQESAQRVVQLTPWYLGSTWRDWSFSRAVCRYLQHTHYDLVQSHERLICCDVFRAGARVQWLRCGGWRCVSIRIMRTCCTLSGRCSRAPDCVRSSATRGWSGRSLSVTTAFARTSSRSCITGSTWRSSAHAGASHGAARSARHWALRRGCLLCFTSDPGLSARAWGRSCVRWRAPRLPVI